MSNLARSRIIEPASLEDQNKSSTLLYWVSKACLVQTIVVFLLISLGGLVRNYGAGLSCPDWPLCYGKVVPPMDKQIFLEWFHRLIAGSVSCLFLGIGLVLLKSKTFRSKIGWYWSFGLVLLGMQIILGGLTVLGLLSPKWVSSHLAVGVLFFSSTLMMWLGSQELVTERKVQLKIEDSNLGRWSTALPVVIYGQMILGALVSSNFAGLACPDFPTCHGDWIPSLSGLVKFQFAHRLGALITTSAFLAVIFQFRKIEMWGRTRFLFWLMPALLILQIALGVGSVLFELPILMSVAHLATGTFLLGSSIVFSREVRRATAY